jgi:hypothetical protein
MSRGGPGRPAEDPKMVMSAHLVKKIQTPPESPGFAGKLKSIFNANEQVSIFQIVINSWELGDGIGSINMNSFQFQFDAHPGTSMGASI